MTICGYVDTMLYLSTQEKQSNPMSETGKNGRDERGKSIVTFGRKSGPKEARQRIAIFQPSRIKNPSVKSLDLSVICLLLPVISAHKKRLKALYVKASSL